MVKTQIMVPDDLYRKAKTIANNKEWSLAEVFRRGLEYMAEVHGHSPDEDWAMPTIACGKGKKLSAKKLQAAIEADQEDYLLDKLQRK